MLALGATLPAAHAMGCSDPVLHEWPNGHGWHSPSAASPLALPNRPAGHESAALLPGGQYAPGPQAMHAVLPVAACIVPAAHGTQLLKPVELATLPATHSVGSVAPVLQL